MSNPVEEFESTLKEFQNAKPPGVSGSRIRKLKDLFISNVQDEEMLTRKLYEGCKATPAPNKLGPFYVVDAILRALKDEINKNGSDVEITESSPAGTAAAAVFRIQSLFPSLVDDIVPVSRDDVKSKISNLVDLWEKFQTFPPEMLSSIKSKYFTSTSTSTTPPGTPPKKKSVRFSEESSVSTAPEAIQAAPPKKDASSVLLALANLSKKTESPASSSAALSKVLSTPPANVASPSSANASAASSDPNAIFHLLQNMNKISGAQTNYQQQDDGAGAGVKGRQALPPQSQSFQSSGDYQPGGGRNYRERGAGRNNNDNPYGRRRDRSPRRNNPLVQDPGAYHDGERNTIGTPHYREKKPFIDPTIPQGFIKVYSRTVFIGGVPRSMTEMDLTQQLRPYAEVQSAILNTDRKHAFVKVYSRKEAENILSGFAQGPHPLGLRAKWGVGFGPRDCCDYQTGISTIPLNRLTDADQKWIVSAEWGGTGGLPLQSGLFVEEPDIEVGHGVSSKSISRRMPTNGATNGPKSDGRNGYNNHNPYADNPYANSNGGSNPGNIAINYGGNSAPHQSPPPQYGGYQQPPPQQQQVYAQPPPPPHPQPQQQQQPGGMDSAAVMAQMMAAMQQQNGGQPMDMASMFQNMANMMKQQQQQPPQ